MIFVNQEIDNIEIKMGVNQDTDNIEINMQKENLTHDNISEEEENNLHENFNETSKTNESTRIKNPPKWTLDYDMSNYCENNINNDDKIWLEAIKDEIRAHLKNGTWFLIDRKKNQKLIAK